MSEQPEKQEYLLVNEEIVDQVCTAIHGLDITGSEHWIVTLETKNKKRSDAQRSLQWVLYTQVADHTGYTKEEVRNMFMLKFAVPIFYRDNIKNSADTIDCINSVKANGLLVEYKELRDAFVRNISSNSFNKKQNIEYLNDIERYCIEKGLPVQMPPGT